jgi:hypothetical protein
MHTERQAGRPDATLGEPGAQSSSEASNAAAPELAGVVAPHTASIQMHAAQNQIFGLFLAHRVSVFSLRNHGRNRGDSGQKFCLVKPSLEDSPCEEFRMRRMGETGGKCRGGVGKSPGKEPARDDQQGSRGRYGDFGVVGCILDGGEQREAGHSSVAMGGSCVGRKRWGVQSGEDLGSICCGGQRLRRAAWRLGDDQRG